MKVSQGRRPCPRRLESISLPNPGPHPNSIHARGPLRVPILLGILFAILHIHISGLICIFVFFTFSIDSQRISTKSRRGVVLRLAGTSNQTTHQHNVNIDGLTPPTTCRQYLLTFNTLTHPSASSARGSIFQLDISGSGLPLPSHHGFPRPRPLGL